MDDQTSKTNLQSELDELLAEITKDHQAFSIKSKVLVAKADKLADELEKTEFSDLEDAEKKVMKDLNAAAAEEVASLELEEEEESKEE
jgi:hypothetical protein